MNTTLFKTDQNSNSNGYQNCFLYMWCQRSCLICTDNNQGDFSHWIKAWFQQLSLMAWNRKESLQQESYYTHQQVMKFMSTLFFIHKHTQIQKQKYEVMRKLNPLYGIVRFGSLQVKYSIHGNMCWHKFSITAGIIFYCLIHGWQGGSFYYLISKQVTGIKSQSANLSDCSTCSSRPVTIPHKWLTFWHRSSTFNSNKSPT
jgi:hypothetical protein